MPCDSDRMQSDSDQMHTSHSFTLVAHNLLSYSFYLYSTRRSHQKIWSRHLDGRPQGITARPCESSRIIQRLLDFDRGHQGSWLPHCKSSRAVQRVGSYRSGLSSQAKSPGIPRLCIQGSRWIIKGLAHTPYSRTVCHLYFLKYSCCNISISTNY
jgi:hypothetical protein